jgi:DNA-binding SARP family transcriptional activator
LRFSILGPLEVTSGQLVLTPSAPKLRQLLTQLVLQCNQIAHTDKLIEELWDTDPPPSARTTLQTYVYQLRKLLATAGRGQERLVVTKPCGYVATIRPESVDACLFDRYLSRGEAAPSPIECEQALAPESLPQRMVAHQLVQLRDQLAVPAQLQVGRDPVVDRL